jgi:hypothetical protein
MTEAQLPDPEAGARLSRTPSPSRKIPGLPAMTPPDQRSEMIARANEPSHLYPETRQAQ